MISVAFETGAQHGLGFVNWVNNEGLPLLDVDEDGGPPTRSSEGCSSTRQAFQKCETWCCSQSRADHIEGTSRAWLPKDMEGS